MKPPNKPNHCPMARITLPKIVSHKDKNQSNKSNSPKKSEPQNVRSSIRKSIAFQPSEMLVFRPTQSQLASLVERRTTLPTGRPTKVEIQRTDSLGNPKLGENFKPVPPIKMSPKDFYHVSRSKPSRGPRVYKDIRLKPGEDDEVPMARMDMVCRAVGRVEKLGGFKEHFSLSNIKKAVSEQTARLMEQFQIKDEKLVRNIVVYAKNLAVPGTAVVDKDIFIAQLTEAFGIADTFLIDRIFELSKSDFCNVLSIEELAKVICIFASPDFIYQAMFCFNVYDFDNNDIIGIPECNKLLLPCAIEEDEMPGEDLRDDAPSEASVKELTVMVLNLFGKTLKDSKIDRFEWYSTVKRDSLLAQCLGTCLPLPGKLRPFLDLLRSKEPYQIAERYQHERKRCLSVPTSQYDQPRLYPIVLEID